MESVRKVAATTIALLIAACGGSGGDGDGGGDGGGGGGSSPSLTIVQPLDGSLAMTTVRIDVRCVDDRPRCEVDVRYYSERCTGRGCTGVVRDYSEVLARGTGGLATTLDLAPYVGSQAGLEFRATDSAGQITTASRTVYVELPDRLTPITTVSGAIADFDGTRLLYFVHDAAGDHPAIYTPSLGVTETIPLEDGWAVYPHRGLSPYNDARLTPDGALFRAERPGGEYRVFLWRSGTLTPLPNSERAYNIFVAGPFAIWENINDFSLYRVDTRTGASELVEPFIFLSADVAADGTVIFENRSGLVSDRAGQRGLLAPIGASDPKIEGSTVAFATIGSSSRSLSLIVGGAAPITVTQPTTYPVEYRPQLAGGWLAFVDTADQPRPQVYRRDPEGTISRITDFGPDGAGILERLAPNGDAMVYGGGPRMLSRGTTLSPIAGDPFESRSYWFNGQWYITIGATLVSVDTSGL